MKLVLYFVTQLNTRLVRICILFYDYLLMVGSIRTEQCPAFAETPALSTSWNQTIEEAEAMECDAYMTLKWRRVEVISRAAKQFQHTE